ncbi:hypothetical protein SAMN05192562_107170 [Kosakonia arachidis]|uniref:Uncharacterized protein n=1 Tax=Kosakonia arachidis TaxID=551989 RepID=A0A1I7DYB6_9ENTR|nr:hypothetical protein [Kosakonia arachidis]SFU16606.1 hypothetical protein SAMN05192562_107170 [Kosakonia arachidis]
MLLLKFLSKALKDFCDIDVVMKIVRKNEYTIPMKSIIQHYDKSEKNALFNEYIYDLSALIFLYGSLGLTDVLC